MTLTTLRAKRGTASLWASTNPVLALGELGWETDTLKGKIGDGATVWNSLPYSLGGKVRARDLVGQASKDWPSIPAGTTAELTMTVTGAAIDDIVIANPRTTLEAGLMWQAYVSATDTVTIRLANVTVAAINPAARVWNVEVLSAS